MVKVACLTVLLLVLLHPHSLATAANEKEAARILWKKMSDVLLYLRPTDRSRFLVLCGGNKDCGENVVSDKGSGMRWDHTPTKEEKGRFWQAYKCFKKQNLKLCPVDGGWGPWTKWAHCSGKCGEESSHNRTRSCVNPRPLHGGMNCNGPSVEEKICRGICPKTGMTPANSKGFIEAKLFVEKLNKGFPILEQECNVNHCSYDQLGAVLNKETKSKYWSSLQCFKYYRACPVDGGWSLWKEWSACQPQCGQGIRWRTRSCTNPSPENGGFPCRGPFYKEEHCFGRNCSSGDFLYGHYLSDWSPFGSCSVSCGNYGIMEKSRVCLKPGECSKQLGDQKNELVIRKPCYRGPCPGTGEWSSWGKFEPCSAVCGLGRSVRLRQCPNVRPLKDMPCHGYNVESESCTGECGANWTVKLDKILEETRKLKVGGNSGNTTTNATQPKDDEAKPAPGDPFSVVLDPRLERTYTSWTPWTVCSKTCGGGNRVRTRECIEKKVVCYGEIVQRQYCNVDLCPVAGGWGDWQSWAVCSVTCGEGVQRRYRQCDSPLPQNGGTCLGEAFTDQKCNNKACEADSFEYGEWQAWSNCTKRCGEGSRTRNRSCKILSTDMAAKQILDKNRIDKGCSKTGATVTHVCNPFPCPVSGKWAHWGDWSECSASCDLGLRYRDRTCTDPAPANGGFICPGPGTEMGHCYTKPCQDSSEVGVFFDGTSWMQYNPAHKPSHFLFLYVLLTPKTQNAVILERFRGCQDTYCTHNLTLLLQHGIPRLVVMDNAYKLDIVGKTKVQHTILVYIQGKGGFMRVDDGDHETAQFSPIPKEPLNYDAKMIVGCNKNMSRDLAFTGEIASLRVNFKPLSLFKSNHWIGHGVPTKYVNVATMKLESYLGYPRFQGKNFVKVPFQESTRFSMKLSFFPLGLNGLLFFNEGLYPGSYLYMIIDNGSLKTCLKSGKDPVCAEISTLRSKTWYYMSVFVSGNAAEVRLNNDTAVQLTTSGPTAYRAGSPIWIGGGSRQDEVIIKDITGQKTGFHGVYHDFNINGLNDTMQGKALLDKNGFINSMGISLADRVDEVWEHAKSIVTMECDFTEYYKTDKHAALEWFHEDQRVLTSVDRIIQPKLPGLRRMGSLVLKGSKHQGIFICAVRHNGILSVQHAFVVSRHNIKLSYKAADVEKTIFHVTMVVCPLLFLACLALAVWQIMKDRRQSALKPVLNQLSTFYRRKPKHVVIAEVEKDQGEAKEAEQDTAPDDVEVHVADDTPVETDHEETDIKEEERETVEEKEDGEEERETEVDMEERLEEEEDEKKENEGLEEIPEEFKEVEEVEEVDEEINPEPDEETESRKTGTVDQQYGVGDIDEVMESLVSSKALNYKRKPSSKHLMEGREGVSSGFDCGNQPESRFVVPKQNLGHSGANIASNTNFSTPLTLERGNHSNDAIRRGGPQDLPLSLSHISPEKRSSMKISDMHINTRSTQDLPLTRFPSMRAHRVSSASLPPPLLPEPLVPTLNPHSVLSMNLPPPMFPGSAGSLRNRGSSLHAGLPPPPPLDLPMQMSRPSAMLDHSRGPSGQNLFTEKDQPELTFELRFPCSLTTLPVVEEIPEPPREVDKEERLEEEEGDKKENAELEEIPEEFKEVEEIDEEINPEPDEETERRKTGTVDQQYGLGDIDEVMESLVSSEALNYKRKPSSKHLVEVREGDSSGFDCGYQPESRFVVPKQNLGHSGANIAANNSTTSLTLGRGNHSSDAIRQGGPPDLPLTSLIYHLKNVPP